MRHLRGLRAQILLWTILPLILILVALSLGSITLHQQSMRTMVAERDGQLAGLAAAHLKDNLRERVLTLSTVLTATARLTDIEGGIRELGAEAATFDQGLAIFDAAGAPLTGVPAALRPEQGDVAALLRSAKDRPGQPAYQLMSTGSGPGLLLMAISDPITKRTAAGALSERGLGLPELFDRISRGRRAEVYLLDNTGHIIYHRDVRQIGKDRSTHSGVPQALRGESGATFEHLRDEDEHVVGYAPLTATGWALLVEEPWVDVIIPALQYTLWAPVLVLVAAIASLIAVHFGLRRVINPLQRLGRSAGRLAWGDFRAIEKPVGGIDEIQDMQSILQEMAAQIHRSQASMQDYIAALTEAQEEERRRLARELHDETVQSLIALGQRVKILALDWKEGCGSKDKATAHGVEARLTELSNMIAQSLKDVRSLIRDLRPIYLEELGLVAALDMLARTTGHGQTEAAFEAIGNERRLSSEAELAVFRIAQAALSNSVRHGKPTRISLRLDFGADGVVLSSEDDGE
jgi:two-component system sensor histidine kinase UhpB